MRLLVSGTTASLRRALPRYLDRLGFLLTPRNGNSLDTIDALGIPWACDNDCFQGLDEARYRRLLARITGRPGCWWVAVPDVVADARATLERFEQWAPEAAATGHPLALVGQDGAEDLLLPWERMGCLFIGGSDAWKLSAAARDLVAEAKMRGLHTHMGRVNSRERMLTAFGWACDSVDGTGLSKWGDIHLHKFCRWLGEMQALRDHPTLW